MGSVTVLQVSQLLAKNNMAQRVISELQYHPLTEHLRCNWIRLWSYSDLGLFAIRERHYEDVKRKIHAATHSKGLLTDLSTDAHLEEMGTTFHYDPAVVVILPQATWDGFKLSSPLHFATVIHELTHAEDYILNGSLYIPGPITVSLWQEFFAESVAAPFYHFESRMRDLLDNGVVMLTDDYPIEFKLGQVGRILGFINGCHKDIAYISSFLSRISTQWCDLANAVYPILKSDLGTRKKPSLAELKPHILKVVPPQHR
jgi:hypothetical protein